jgi:hypothetical protein
MSGAISGVPTGEYTFELYKFLLSNNVIQLTRSALWS